jgi:hypothetical protein
MLEGEIAYRDVRPMTFRWAGLESVLIKVIKNVDLTLAIQGIVVRNGLIVACENGW